MYYEEGKPQISVTPDVFVVFGVEKHNRGTYKIWEEDHKSPNFLLEITSKITRSKDQGAKKRKKELMLF